MFAEPGDLRSQRRAQSLRLMWIKGTEAAPAGVSLDDAEA
jgi:hypothetical protein